jgi:hypothetical protein
VVGIVVTALPVGVGPTTLGGRDLDSQAVPGRHTSSGCHHLHLDLDHLVWEQRHRVLTSVRMPGPFRGGTFRVENSMRDLQTPPCERSNRLRITCLIGDLLLSVHDAECDVEVGIGRRGRDPQGGPEMTRQLDALVKWS